MIFVLWIFLHSVGCTAARQEMGCSTLPYSQFTCCYVKSNLEGATNLAEVGQDVVGRAVGQVVQQVLVGARAGHHSLDEVAEHGKHSKATVLDLLQLHLVHVVLAQVHHVEELAAGVGRVARAAEHGLDANEVLLAHGAGVAVVLGWRPINTSSLDDLTVVSLHIRCVIRYLKADWQQGQGRGNEGQIQKMLLL